MSQLGIDQRELGALTFGEAVGQPGPQQSPATPKLSYPRHYVWITCLALLDIALTSLVLSTGGHELNALARLAIEHAGVFGMIGVKALTLAVIVAICEYVGRREPVKGRRIVEFALAANSVAVAFGLMYLAEFGLAFLRL
jgi:hypothetical protein